MPQVSCTLTHNSGDPDNSGGPDSSGRILKARVCRLQPRAFVCAVRCGKGSPQSLFLSGPVPQHAKPLLLIGVNIIDSFFLFQTGSPLHARCPSHHAGHNTRAVFLVPQHRPPWRSKMSVEQITD